MAPGSRSSSRSSSFSLTNALLITVLLLKPIVPHRGQTGWQGRQIAQFHPTVIGAVKIRTGRRQKTILASHPGIRGVFIRMMAAGYHFDCLSAQITEFGK